MTHTLNLRRELYAPETERFERTMSEKYGRQVVIRDIPIKNFVDVDAKLLETKVSQLFMKGATDGADFWQDLINVVQMKSPIERVPLISQRNFKVRRGRVSKTAREHSGGKIAYAELNTNDDNKNRYVYFEVDTQDVKLRNFDSLEKSIMAAGKAFAKNILDEITAFYDAVSGQETQALSSDKRFVAVNKLMAKQANAGFEPNLLFFEAVDFSEAITEETTGGTMPWLMTLQNGQPLGDNFGKGIYNGLVGRLFGRTPVYSIANADAGMAGGEIFSIDKDAAGALGFAPGGQIDLQQEIKKIDDIIENAIQARYDIAGASDNAKAVGTVTGA